MRRVRDLPWLTAGLVATALWLSLLPGAAESLEYRRAAVDAGEWWRPITGQLVHWTARMTLVDLGAVLLLGAALEPRSRGRLALVLATAGLAIGAALHVVTTDVDRYRGSSGLGAALLAALVAASAVSERPVVRRLALAVAALFVVKVVVESTAAAPLAAGPMPDGVRVLAGVHVLGAVAGVSWGIDRAALRRRGRRMPTATVGIHGVPAGAREVD